jgi:hypothetical protein
MADLQGRMFGAMQMDVKTLSEIDADSTAMGQAVTVIVIAGVASLIGNFFSSGVTAGVLGLCRALVGYALFSFLVFLIGTKLMPEPATKADFNECFRVIGFAASPGVLSVLAMIPVLGVFISFCVDIWSLMIAVVAVREVLDYSGARRAIVVCFIAAVICAVVWLTLLLPLLIAALHARATLGR